MVKCHGYIVPEKPIASDNFKLILFLFSSMPAKIFHTSFFISVTCSPFWFVAYFLAKSSSLQYLLFWAPSFSRLLFSRLAFISPNVPYLPSYSLVHTFSVYLQSIFVLCFKIPTVNFLMHVNNLLNCHLWV